MPEQTIFQKIIAREIPANILHEDDLCIAIEDIDPQAPSHALIIPKKLIPRVGEALPEDKELLGHLLLTAAAVMQKRDGGAGFRIVVNNGENGGETVPHLHVHALAGRPLEWPPG